MPRKIPPEAKERVVEGATYAVRFQLLGNGSYGPYPGDAGLIFPNVFALPNRDRDLRIGYIKLVETKERFECAACGNKFETMGNRDGHYRRRHIQKRAAVKNMEDFTEEQREIIKAEISSDSPDHPSYMTSPADFNVPDPEDAAMLQEERKIEATTPLYLDKTKASRGVK